MNIKEKLRVLLEMAVALAITQTSFAANTENVKPPGSMVWIERPWNIRYFLHFEDAHSMKIGQKVAVMQNLEKERSAKPAVYFSYKALFNPTTVLHLSEDDNPAVAVLTFDRLGNVQTKNNKSLPLKGKLNQLHDLVLVTSDTAKEPPYLLADWFWGISGDGAVFSPGVCDLHDADRYAAGFHASSYAYLGNFGCREWTYQLYDPDQPYINVTSYEKDGTYIKEFVGWSRFNDPPKPIIGKQDKTWLCLHECPAGDVPGVIPDIAAWCKKHGFALPQRPDKQPMFPNADYPYDPEE